MAVKGSHECKTNSSWRYFCCSSIVCNFCSVACMWVLSEVRGAPNSQAGHMGLLHPGAVGNMEGIACSRILPRISLLACWVPFPMRGLGKRGMKCEYWEYKQRDAQSEDCYWHLLLLFASADLARAGTCSFLISSCLWRDSLRSWQRSALGIRSD